jgi:hypothetical protein
MNTCNFTTNYWKRKGKREGKKEYKIKIALDISLLFETALSANKLKTYCPVFLFV